MNYKTQEIFFYLVKAGLFGQDAIADVPYRFQYDEEVLNWEEVYQLAEEQSIVGLVAAGIDLLPPSLRPPKEVAYLFIGRALQLEQRNRAMNEFVANLISLLRKNEIYVLLLKGQGIAQCYEKPLWRASGDVDLFLSETNYQKAKEILIPLASSVDKEIIFQRHLGLVISGWEVELHGTHRPRLTRTIDEIVDEVQGDVFYGGNVREVSFKGSSGAIVPVFLPGPDSDVVFVFTHILHHYYQDGVGLRQICDWCRLLWAYNGFINHELLKRRLKKMGLMSEWKAFAAFAVEYLSMPVNALPLFDETDYNNANYKRKAKRICDFIMEVGNFGHSRRRKKGNSILSRKLASFWRRTTDSARHFMVFPKNSLKIWWYMMITGVKVLRGE